MRERDDLSRVAMHVGQSCARALPTRLSESFLLAPPHLSNWCCLSDHRYRFLPLACCALLPLSSLCVSNLAHPLFELDSACNRPLSAKRTSERASKAGKALAPPSPPRSSPLHVLPLPRVLTPSLSLYTSPLFLLTFTLPTSLSPSSSSSLSSSNVELAAEPRGYR